MDTNKKFVKNSYLSKFGYVVLKNNLTTKEKEKITEELIAKPITDSKFGSGNKNFRVYVETKTKFYLPKVYGLNNFGYPEIYCKNYIGEGWSQDQCTKQKIKFVGKLYEEQEKVSKILLDNLLDKTGTGSGILCLQTGGGKTVTALHVLSKLQKKTIIVVNKISLLDQWKNEINKFLPNARVGIIRGRNQIDVENKDIILTMLQSISRFDYPKEIFSDIGVTVVDECHTTSSKVFYKALAKLNSEYSIGLSATPNRSDGCEYVYKWFLGEVVYNGEKNIVGLPPVINTININSNKYELVVRNNSFTGREQIDFSGMVTNLINIRNRNLFIVETIKALANNGRKILVLSDRRQHLSNIKNILDDDIEITLSNSFNYGLFVGRMKLQELNKSREKNVILATYQAFGEGISEKDLDTLFLITPKKFIGHIKASEKKESGKLEQIVGRIFRKQHTERHPMIVDLFDNYSIYRNQAKQRNVFYSNYFKNAIYKKITAYIDQQEKNTFKESINQLLGYENTDIVEDENYEYRNNKTGECYITNKSGHSYCMID